MKLPLALAFACSAAALAALPAGPTPAGQPLASFERHGIVLTYPRAWRATDRPLSNGREPVSRFALGNFAFRRTSRDSGPCLAGIAKQRPPGGVLAYAREARGADKILARFPKRPTRLRLPTQVDNAACLGGGTRQTHFKENCRAFYLWISIGERASARDRAALARALNGLRIERLPQTRCR